MNKGKIMRKNGTVVKKHEKDMNYALFQSVKDATKSKDNSIYEDELVSMMQLKQMRNVAKSSPPRETD